MRGRVLSLAVTVQFWSHRRLTLIISILVFAALAGFGQQALAMQITFVQAPQNRNQTQTQQGLPPEKKRSLSKYGPEDVFPGANEQEEGRPRESRPRRRAQSATTSRSASVPRQSEPPVAMPSVTPARLAMTTPSPTITPSRLAAAAPSPAIIAAALDNQVRQPPLAQQSIFTEVGSRWTVPILSGLALAVSAALIYVLTKLREKIREGSSG